MKCFLTLALTLNLLFATAGCSRNDDAAATHHEHAEHAGASTLAQAEGQTDCPGGGACGTVAAGDEAVADGPQPAHTDDSGARLFGTELSTDREAVDLAALIASPNDYAGQVVKTEGTISAVCQRMGCWMEMTTAEGGPAVRVPMAGHSFFLPRDVSGARATVEGSFEVAELPAATQEHLREEGAQAADQSLAITATGVLIHAS
ncbi:MAG: DUF4920 domain-containing protein [Deltaproteobacteria bacterium]|nr:DUF4920 domain-containing protein [Deltaproteobacteria bacterium]